MTEPHITIEELVAWVSGELEAADGDRVAHAVAESPRLQADADRMRRLLLAIRDEEAFESPTAEAIRRARALGRPALTPTDDWVSRAVRVVISLIHDSRAEPALAGWRSGGDRHQLAFTHGPMRLDVQIAPDPDSTEPAWRLQGQVSPREATVGTPVAMTNHGTDQVVASTEVDDRGRFRLTVGRGEFDLLVRSAEGTALAAPGIRID